MAKRSRRRGKASTAPSAMAGKKSTTTRSTTMDNDGKLKILRVMTALYDAVARAASAARREGWPEEAALLDHWHSRLGEAIDRLRAAVLEAWKGDAAKLATTVRGLSAEVEKAIKKLEAGSKTAEAAVTVAGKVDDAIKAAAKLLA